MNIRVNTEGANTPQHAADEIQLVLTFSVEDAGRLWDAAAQRCAQAADDLTLVEIVESIGPREDPSIEDCIKMLALLPGLDGCTVTNLSVRQARKMVAASESETCEALLESPPGPTTEVPHLYSHLPFNTKRGTNCALHGAS